MKKLIILTGLLLSTSAYAQTEVTAGVTRGKDYGVTYALPKTAINIEVKVNKVTYTPGEFSKYADRYLRLTDVSGEPQEYWKLVSVKAKSVGIPDSEHTYFVKLKDKTVAPLIELTEDGIVKSINVPLSPKKSAPMQPATTQKKKINPRDFLTEEILMAGSTAKMAELVAKEIYNIRESKNALVRGQADNMPKDGEQLKIMLANLEEQEAAMTEMFSGTLNKDEKIFNIRLKLQTNERKIILGIHNVAILAHLAPMPVVDLLDKLVKLTVLTLRFNDKIQKGFQIVFPMAHCLHNVNVIADPVFIGHQNFSVNKDQTSVGKNIALHLM